MLQLCDRQHQSTRWELSIECDHSSGDEKGHSGIESKRDDWACGGLSKLNNRCQQLDKSSSSSSSSFLLTNGRGQNHWGVAERKRDFIFDRMMLNISQYHSPEDKSS